MQHVLRKRSWAVVQASDRARRGDGHAQTAHTSRDIRSLSWILRELNRIFSTVYVISRGARRGAFNRIFSTVYVISRGTAGSIVCRRSRSAAPLTLDAALNPCR